MQKENTLEVVKQKYTFTGKYKPFAHQRKTALFSTQHKKSFCFNEQGTGKTASAIWASDFLMQQGKVNRVLVICPLSIMDSAWRGDLETFAPHRTVDIAHGTPIKRKAILGQGADFVIINWTTACRFSWNHSGKAYDPKKGIAHLDYDVDEYMTNESSHPTYPDNEPVIISQSLTGMINTQNIEMFREAV